MKQANAIALIFLLLTSAFDARPMIKQKLSDDIEMLYQQMKPDQAKIAKEQAAAKVHQIIERYKTEVKNFREKYLDELEECKNLELAQKKIEDLTKEVNKARTNYAEKCKALSATHAKRKKDLNAHIQQLKNQQTVLETVSKQPQSFAEKKWSIGGTLGDILSGNAEASIDQNGVHVGVGADSSILGSGNASFDLTWGGNKNTNTPTQGEQNQPQDQTKTVEQLLKGGEEQEPKDQQPIAQPQTQPQPEAPEAQPETVEELPTEEQEPQEPQEPIAPPQPQQQPQQQGKTVDQLLTGEEQPKDQTVTQPEKVPEETKEDQKIAEAIEQQKQEVAEETKKQQEELKQVKQTVEDIIKSQGQAQPEVIQKVQQQIEEKIQQLEDKKEDLKNCPCDCACCSKVNYEIDENYDEKIVKCKEVENKILIHFQERKDNTKKIGDIIAQMKNDGDVPDYIVKNYNQVYKDLQHDSEANTFIVKEHLVGKVIRL